MRLVGRSQLSARRGLASSHRVRSRNRPLKVKAQVRDGHTICLCERVQVYRKIERGESIHHHPFAPRRLRQSRSNDHQIVDMPYHSLINLSHKSPFFCHLLTSRFRTTNVVLNVSQKHYMVTQHRTRTEHFLQLEYWFVIWW